MRHHLLRYKPPPLVAACMNEEIRTLRAERLELSRAHAAAEAEHAAALEALQDAHAAELQAVHRAYAEKAVGREALR
jgi:hypothetical protein